jgi:hypothetical protein
MMSWRREERREEKWTLIQELANLTHRWGPEEAMARTRYPTTESTTIFHAIPKPNQTTTVQTSKARTRTRLLATHGAK